MTAGQATGDDVPPSTKKVALRRGTHSCWACKRRKIKCVPSVDHSDVCRACHKRGTACIGQDTPEETATQSSGERKRIVTDSRGREGSSTIVAGAARPRRLARYTSSYHETGSEKWVPGRGIELIARQHSITHNLSHDARQGRLASLSSFLHGSLPCEKDMQIIRSAVPASQLTHAFEMLATPYTSLLADQSQRPDMLKDDPGPDAHPVLVARYMLIIASLLQHMDESVHQGFEDLSEKTITISERLAELAINLVTTKDELLGSLEGLECLLLESVYLTNAGNVRRSWLTVRRAVSMGQLMGLGRGSLQTHIRSLQRQYSMNAQLIWFRIVFLDRSLSLMLGLPQACTEYHLPVTNHPDVDLPCTRLEQAHCYIAGKILERNQRTPNPQDIALTQALDQRLREAVRELPSGWWLTPQPQDAVSTCASTRHLFAQSLHYNLLNQLHLPFLLRSTWNGQDYTFSRTTCVHASREVVLRYIALRSFNKMTASCRIIDFLALMAATTLMLAYMDADPTEFSNVMAQSYPGDRAMIEQVYAGFANMLRERNVLNARCAELLGRLLDIDRDARSCCVRQTSDKLVRLHVPYFGTIEIIDNGVRLVDTSGRAGTWQVGQHTTTTADAKVSSALPSADWAEHNNESGGLENIALPSPDYSDMPAEWTFTDVDLAVLDSATSSTFFD